MRGLERQTSIYAEGVSGQRPRVPTDATLLEERAGDAMSPEAFAYVAGGAGTGATMRANRAAFDRWRIVPRMLRDVSERDTSVELFGRTLPAPFLVAPIGVLEMAHREAERAVARAVRLRGDRRDARHHDARLADARPGPGLAPLPAGDGDRSVHERPGVHPVAVGAAR